jgi:hypothetical protein
LSHGSGVGAGSAATTQATTGPPDSINGPAARPASPGQGIRGGAGEGPAVRGAGGASHG